jgi:hypothetical protein
MRRWLSAGTVTTGVLWVVGIAVQVGGWVNHRIAVAGLVFAALWTLVFLCYRLRNRGANTDRNSLESDDARPTDGRPTVGIDAEGSIINAPKARIRNQDTAIKSRDSVINIPNADITDSRKK